MVELTPLSQLAVCRREPDAVFARQSGRGVSYGEWLRRVRSWRNAFVAVDGSDVAMHFEDAIELSAALWGAWHAGKAVWLPGDNLPATVEALGKHVSAMAGTLPGGLSAAPRSEDAPLQALDPEQTRLHLFTSGSSGRPVALEKRLRQLEAEVFSLEACFGARMGPVEVHGTVSPQHIYGLLFRVLWPASGARVFVAERLEYPEQIAERLGVPEAVLVSSPAHLKRLPEALDYSATRRALRALFSSGGPLSDEAAEAAIRLLGQPPIEVYGSTETGGVAWRQRLGSGACWQALPGVVWRVVDEQLELQSSHLRDNHWYRSEDRVRAAGAGFELIGRADRILKIEERRISLSAVERALIDSELLTDVRVIGLPGRRILLGVAAVPSAAGWSVLREEGRQALTARLQRALRGRVDPTAMPRRWRFIQTMPSDARGKSPEHLLATLFRPVHPEPRWLMREPDKAVVELAVDPELRVLDGHFPQAAIVPGVALVGWALRFAREVFDRVGEPERLDVLKFQQVVRPETTLRLELDFSAEKGQLTFRYSAGEHQHASGRMHFKPGQAA